LEFERRGGSAKEINMIYQYWIIGELVFVILFFSVIIFNLWRNAKNKTGKITLHETAQANSGITQNTFCESSVWGWGLCLGFRCPS